MTMVIINIVNDNTKKQGEHSDNEDVDNLDSKGDANVNADDGCINNDDKEE